MVNAHVQPDGGKMELLTTAAKGLLKAAFGLNAALWPGGKTANGTDWANRVSGLMRRVAALNTKPSVLYY